MWDGKHRRIRVDNLLPDVMNSGTGYLHTHVKVRYHTYLIRLYLFYLLGYVTWTEMFHIGDREKKIKIKITRARLIIIFWFINKLFEKYRNLNCHFVKVDPIINKPLTEEDWQSNHRRKHPFWQLLPFPLEQRPSSGCYGMITQIKVNLGSENVSATIIVACNLHFSNPNGKDGRLCYQV